MRRVMPGMLPVFLAGGLCQLCGASPAAQAGKPGRSAAGELLSAVMSDRWCLFGSAQSAALDDINRRWREVDLEVEKAADAAAKATGSGA